MDSRGPGAPPSRKRPRHSSSSSGARSSSAAAPRARAAAPRSWGGEREGALLHRHGNWNTRVGGPPSARWGDARLSGASASWFTGAAVLDVGCGAGYTSLAVAERWGVASVMGVDVDAALVAAARRNQLDRRRELHMEAAISSSASTSAATAPLPWVPLSLRVVQRMPACVLGAGAAAASSGAASACEPQGAEASSGSAAALAQEPASAGASRAHEIGAASLAAPSPLDKVAFRHEDCVGDTTLGHAPGSYGVVLCLAVTKWVHINYGDRGLLTLFRRLHSYLQPGGRLLLGAQPWASYRGTSRVSADLRTAYEAIRLRPEGFAEFLLARVGFRALEATLEYRKASGAVRHILVLVK